MVTHDARMIKWSDRVYRMKDGDLIEETEGGMPKSTFLNLPNEKKQRLIEILLENFSARHISQVKVADIVEDMAMSRGAFYKYFEDLEDAYTYTIQYYSIQIHRDILKYISQNKQDFFKELKITLRGVVSWNKKVVIGRPSAF